MAEENFEMEVLKNSNKRTGQHLQVSEDHETVSQEISLEKAGLSTPQTFSVTTKSENLLSVTQDGKMVASFQEKEDGSLQMTASKEFVDNFFSKYENLDLGAKAEDAENYVFDMANLRLTKSGNLETSEVRANNTAFAIMFSALGSQIRDAAGNRAVQTNTEKPFNLTVSTQFIENALQEKSGCTLDMAEPIFSALMISRIQLERNSGNNLGENAQRTLSVNLGDISLHSVPIQRKGYVEPEYLNIMQRNGKSFLYVQTRNARGQLTSPQFYEINNVALQQAGEKTGLYFGLLDRSKISDILAEVDFEENKGSLSSLSSILSKEFTKTSPISERNTNGIPVMPAWNDMPIYNISDSQAYNEIVDFGNVRALERRNVSPEREMNRNRNNFVDPNDPGTTAPAPGPETTEPERQPEQNNTVPPKPNQQEQPLDQNPENQQEQPLDQNPENQQEEQTQKEETKPKTKKSEKQWKDLEIKPQNPDLNKTLAALFALSVLISVMVPVPFLLIAPYAIGMFALVANLVHPINTVKKIINWAHHVKEKRAEVQEIKHLNRESKIYKLRQKITNKEKRIEYYTKLYTELDKEPKTFWNKHKLKNLKENMQDAKIDKIVLENKLKEEETLLKASTNKKSLRKAKKAIKNEKKEFQKQNEESGYYDYYLEDETPQKSSAQSQQSQTQDHQRAQNSRQSTSKDQGISHTA